MSNILLDLMGALKGSVATPSIFVDGGTSGSPDSYIDNTPIGTALVNLQFSSDGTAFVNLDNGSNITLTDWATPNSLAPGGYQIRGTIISGAPNLGTFGSWLTLTSNRLFGISRSITGTVSTTFRIEIKDSTGPVLSEGYFTLTADRT
jgi:hypothetical protein